jgi:hypothetical protein
MVTIYVPFALSIISICLIIKALKQNIQKVNVERNRTALTRNSSFNIASVIDLAGLS